MTLEIKSFTVFVPPLCLSLSLDLDLYLALKTEGRRNGASRALNT